MTDQNPFDDPEVQKAAAQAAAPVVASVAADPNVQNAVWGAAMNSAYSGNDMKSSVAKDTAVQGAVMGAAMGHFTGNKPGPPPAPKANNSAAPADDAYGTGWDPEQQNQQPAPPEEKSLWNDFVSAMGTCSAYLPLRYLLMFAGAFLIFAAIFDFIKFQNALDFFVNIYLMVFGVLIIVIEIPRTSWNQKVQDRIFYWAMFVARLWGRAWLYFFVAILCVMDFRSWPKGLAGVFVIFLVIVMYFVGVNSATKLKRMNVFVTKGTEGEQRKEMYRAKFVELDTAQMNHLTGDHIKILAEQADRTLSSSECETIMRFFNYDFRGEITLAEWLEGFEEAEKGVKCL